MSQGILCIPCRGKGSRIRAARPDGCKLLLDVQGKPSVLWQIEAFRSFVDRIVIETLPEHGDAVRNAIGNLAEVNARHPERNSDGPALTLKLAMKGIDAPGRTSVTVLFSDTLLHPRWGLGILELLNPYTAVVCTVRDGARFLNVRHLRDGTIVDWIDHPGRPDPAAATIGLYTLPLFQWQAILHEAEQEPASYLFFQEVNMQAVRVPEWVWLDIGTEEGYRRTIRELGKSEAI